MALVKSKKRNKSVRMHGKGRGTHGGGARKKRKGSGHRGGFGMAGTGKRADQKKTLVNKLYGHGYFGKKGITSTGTKRDKQLKINLREIEVHLDKYGKKVGDRYEIELKKHKILGEGEVKHKLFITAFEASKSAIVKVKKAGGEIIVKEIKGIETPLVESPRVKARKSKAVKK